MDFLDFREMQGGAWEMAARPAGRAGISIPTPLVSWWFHDGIHGNRLVYIHSKWMDFLDFRKMQGGAWDMTARPAGRAAIFTPLDS